MRLLEKEENVVATPVAVRPAPALAPRTTARPHVAPRAATRRNPLAEVGGRTLGFALAVGAVYVTSTLLGYVALERARQSARHGAERAAYARGEAKAAREGIEALTNPAALRAWAEAHGFVAGETVETAVARR